MKRVIQILSVILTLYGTAAFSQTRFYNSKSTGGEIKLRGSYQNQISSIGSVNEDQSSLYFIGGIAFRNSSFLWNNDIINFTLDAEYNPESRRETYLLIPDRSEVRTLSRLDFSTTMLQNRVVTVNAYVNLNQSYYNRELLTNIKSDNRRWGGLFSLNNKILPASVSFYQTDWKQKELPSGRTFTMKQENLTGRLAKSFSRNDSHELIYTYDNYNYNYAGSREVNNVINKIGLTNNLFFDRERKYNLSSQLSQYDQAGDNPFSKSEATERLMLSLPAGFRFTSIYNFNRLSYESEAIRQDRISGSVNHQLFESLYTTLSTEFSMTDQDYNNENNLKALIDIYYTKKIGKGVINLGYRFSKTYIDVEGAAASVKIFNEEHILSDSRIILLNKPNIDISSVVIKDITGIIVYQINFDYTLIIRNDYIEIQRIPGGLISDNQIITADYTALQPGSYSYESNNNSLSAGLLLFNKLFEIYYRGSLQSFDNLIKTEFLTINHYIQNVYGGRLDFGFGGLGVEYDNYNSNIIPYKRLRYYMDFNWRFRSRFLISVNGDMSDYQLIDDNSNQQHINISGKVAYILSSAVRLEGEAGYLSQQGRNIDFDLLSSKMSVTSTYRQILMKAGLELYYRNYAGSNFKYTGIYCEVIRKF